MHKAVALFIFAFAPAAMFAVDGQILINQATVMAAGGFPYAISQPGSYKLSGNLVVPTGQNGILFQSSNVTLDLNGFSIKTTPNYESFAFVAGGPNRSISAITIRNGMIQGFPSLVATTVGNYPTLPGQSWALENLSVTFGLELPPSIYLYANARIEHVTAGEYVVAVDCPSVVAFTVGRTVFGSAGTSGCALTGNAQSNP